MQTKAKDTDTAYRDHELGEELAGVLMAIRGVSKRLAGRLTQLERQTDHKAEGGKRAYGTSQRVVRYCGRD